MDWSRGSLAGFFGPQAEEQGLADHCLDHSRLKGLRDEKHGFRLGASKQALRKCRDKNDGDADRLQNLVDGFETRASIREMNIGENQ